MKGIKVLAFFVALSTAFLANAQKAKQPQAAAFKTDPLTGVQYRFIKHDKVGVKPVENNYAHISMVWKGKTMNGAADSVFIDTHIKGGDSIGAISIKLSKSFKGCLEQGVMMMAKGDSAVFKVKGDSLFLKTFHVAADKLPPFVSNSTVYTFYIKLLGFQTEEQVKAEQQAAVQKRADKAAAMKTQEPGVIADYLKKNNYNIQPDADGIYYLQTTPGTGKQVMDGDSIGVKYKGTFLDGKVFDASANHGPGNEIFKLKFAQNMPLIKGWISVLGKMHEGEKVTVLIPSDLAYGAHGSGMIQPYTPLIFEMEMVHIKSN